MPTDLCQRSSKTFWISMSPLKGVIKNWLLQQIVAENRMNWIPVTLLHPGGCKLSCFADTMRKVMATPTGMESVLYFKYTGRRSATLYKDRSLCEKHQGASIKYRSFCSTPHPDALFLVYSCHQYILKRSVINVNQLRTGGSVKLKSLRAIATYSRATG